MRYKKPFTVHENPFGEGAKDYQAVVDDGTIWIYDRATNRYTDQHQLSRNAKRRILLEEKNQ